MKAPGGIIEAVQSGRFPHTFFECPVSKNFLADLNSYFPWDCASECTILDAKFFIHK